MSEVTGKQLENMTDLQRAKALANSAISAPTLDYSKLDALDNSKEMDDVRMARGYGKAQSSIKKLLDKLGAYRLYNNENVDVEFEFTRTGGGKSAREQLDRTASLNAQAKMFTILSDVIEAAVPVETHPDLKSNNLARVYVLFSAFVDKNDIIPVQLEIKVPKIRNESAKLYVAVTLGNKKNRSPEDAPYLKGQVSVSRPVFWINVPHLIENVNDANGSFLQYIPNKMLTQEQIAAKNKAIDYRYFKAVQEGDMEQARKRAQLAAKNAGYNIRAYHGTSKEFTEFKTNNKRTRGSLNLGTGIYFTPNKSSAEMYTETGRVVEAYLKLSNPYEFFGNRFNKDDLDAISELSGKETTIDNVRDVLQEMGYDGIIARDYNGTENPVNQYVLFDANQIKSADPVTYDDNGKVIPLSERFNPDNKDIRYSLPNTSITSKSNSEIDFNAAAAKRFTDDRNPSDTVSHGSRRVFL